MTRSKTIFSKYYIQGLHCASCQIIIEKRLIKLPEIRSVDVSLADSTVLIEHQSAFSLTPKTLNQIFQSDGYRFARQPFNNNSTTSFDNCELESVPKVSKTATFLTALVFVFAFILLNRFGFSSLVSVNHTSALPLFFTFGLLAGFSSCAALTGGIVLSLSKQWLAMYQKSDSFIQKSTPHWLFNGGRLLSYTVLGGILGVLGNFFRLSPLFTASMVILVSLGMALLGLQMLGVKSLQKFQFSLPRALTGKIADESNFKGKYAPFLMGALTFFLPCGFTITAQALALSSGSPLRGALIMGLFALGTLPGLLAIGLSSVKLYSNPRLSSRFSLVAGLLVLFFAAFNINAQMAVLGAPGLDSFLSSSAGPSSRPAVSADSLPPVVNGVQVVKMDASSSGYSPNYLKVRAGVPIRWEITDKGTSGCTNAVISRSLFQGRIDLVPGTTSVKEFTVKKPGKYRFSCWMGMVSGTLEAVDSSGNSGSANALPVDSGAKGCGCGGGAAGNSGSCH